MGSCCSTEEQMRSKALNREIKHTHTDDRKTKKLLLLGAGGSGKSTFFKQLKFIHGEDRQSEREHETFAPIVYSNIVQGMITLTKDFDEWGMPENAQLAQEFQEIDEEEFVLKRNFIGKAVPSMWADPNLQDYWQRKRKDLQLQDSFAYFCESIDRISAPDYQVTMDDIVRARIRTTGIVEQTFQIKQNKFQVFDVGGQRNERKKWIHCFEKVTAVIFLASLAAYNATLYEDDQTNRMKEALDLFKQICNSRWFKETAMILFLNKKDLFQIQIEERGEYITTCFPEYGGETKDVIESREYIKERFVEMNAVKKMPNGKSKKKALFVHFTCVIDRNHVEKIFRDVQSLIIQANLEKAALI